MNKLISRIAAAAATAALLAAATLALAAPSQAAAVGSQCYADVVVQDAAGSPVAGAKVRIPNAADSHYMERLNFQWAYQDAAYDAALTQYQAGKITWPQFDVVQKAKTAKAVVAAEAAYPTTTSDLVAVTDIQGKARIVSPGYWTGGAASDCESMKQVAVKAIPAGSGLALPTKATKIASWNGPKASTTTIVLTK